jgi:CO/xanthine dehydrogenase Mo-binding subunit
MTTTVDRLPDVLGRSIPMPDAEERVVGTLRYTVDHSVEGMVHGKLVRSPYPHAKLVDVEVSGALAQDGVLRVLTGADIELAVEIPNPYFGLTRRDQAPLAIGSARYVGDPVALVIAETAQSARDGAEAVIVDYDELPYVIEPMEALAPGAPQLHEEWPGNECGEWRLHRGDVDLAMSQATHVFEATYTSPMANAVPFEPHVAIAAWEDDFLEVWTATQWPSAVRGELAHMFDTEPGKVQIRVFPLGGGYGAKSQLKIEPMVAAAAKMVGRPVRLELERDEVFLTTGKHPAVMHIRTGVDAEGRFVAREIDLVYNGGAYAVMTPKAVAQGLLRSIGPYRFPNIRIRSRGVYTNTVPSGSFRGAMTNQAAFAYESHADEIAEGLGIDPVDLRERNLLQEGDVFASGQVMHDIHFQELLSDVAAVIGWGEETAPTPGKAVGKGIAVIVKTTPPGTRSEVRVEMRSDGDVLVHTNSVDMGQGVLGTLAQLTAHHLGVDIGKVRVQDPDSSTFDSMTAGSRTTFVADHAIGEACESLRRQLAELADPGDDPGLHSAADYEEILMGAGVTSLIGEGAYQSTPSDALSNPLDIEGDVADHWHQGAVAVEVAVDVETGRVEILRCHGAAWAGRVVNPVRVRQQSEGSIIFGIGPALFEEVMVADGQVTNPNLSDYMIPSIVDVPIELTSSSLESPDRDAAIHGVGEMTIPAVAPAIANAIARATGARVRQMPMTSERVLRAIVGEPE